MKIPQIYMSQLDSEIRLYVLVGFSMMIVNEWAVFSTKLSCRHVVVLKPDDLNQSAVNWLCDGDVWTLNGDDDNDDGGRSGV